MFVVPMVLLKFNQGIMCSFRIIPKDAFLIDYFFNCLPYITCGYKLQSVFFFEKIILNNYHLYFRKTSLKSFNYNSDLVDI